MKRNLFFLISALLSWVLGLIMMLLRETMVKSSPSDINIFGIALVTIGVINFFSRNDPGSKALTAIMIGNIFLYMLVSVSDAYYYTHGFVILSNFLIFGLVCLLMIIGFVYYLFKMPKVQS